MRLAARIGKLREMGFLIDTEYRRSATGARYANYTLNECTP